MGKRRTRIDTTAAERYDRWEERARQSGMRRLFVWLPAEAFERLQTLAQTVAKVALEHGQELRTVPTAAKPRRVGANAGKSVSANGAALSSEAREMVIGWRGEGASWGECARRLDERGIEPPRGGKWLQGRGQTNLARYFPGL
jgi:hypothetical protein